MSGVFNFCNNMCIDLFVCAIFIRDLYLCVFGTEIPSVKNYSDSIELVKLLVCAGIVHEQVTIGKSVFAGIRNIQIFHV